MLIFWYSQDWEDKVRAFLGTNKFFLCEKTLSCLRLCLAKNLVILSILPTFAFYKPSSTSHCNIYVDKNSYILPIYAFHGFFASYKSGCMPFKHAVYFFADSAKAGKWHDRSCDCAMRISRCDRRTSSSYGRESMADIGLCLHIRRLFFHIAFDGLCEIAVRTRTL